MYYRAVNARVKIQNTLKVTFEAVLVNLEQDVAKELVPDPREACFISVVYCILAKKIKFRGKT